MPNHEIKIFAGRQTHEIKIFAGRQTHEIKIFIKVLVIGSREYFIIVSVSQSLVLSIRPPMRERRYMIYFISLDEVQYRFIRR